MQEVGLIAIGFVLGAVFAWFFGKQIAATAVADAKVVAWDAGQVMSSTASSIKTAVATMEMRLHAKLEGMKSGAANEIKKI